MDRVTKRYGDKVAVDSLSFTVQPGMVTGFLGPNGSGKSTTIRVIMGLVNPTSGTATVNGRSLADQTAPMHAIGALIEAKAIHPGRSAYDHLSALAATNGIPDRRVREVIGLVGLSSVARERAGSFSLGMGQRLGVAAALLGDPDTIILDEPVNGLDPEGVLWIRHLLRNLADEGRTVFVSSHLISEMGLIADHLIIVGRGRMIADMSMDQFRQVGRDGRVDVRTQRVDDLTQSLLGAGVTIESTDDPAVIRVTGLSAAEIGDRAFARGIPLHELVPGEASLDETLLTLTHDAAEHQPRPAAA